MAYIRCGVPKFVGGRWNKLWSRLTEKEANNIAYRVLCLVRQKVALVFHVYHIKETVILLFKKRDPILKKIPIYSLTLSTILTHAMLKSPFQ